MAFASLPVETQLKIYSYLNRPQLERLCLVNRRCNDVITSNDHLWPLHRLTLVIPGESRLYRLHNFDVGAMREVTHVAFYRLLRRTKIEFVLLTEETDSPMPDLDHLPRQLWRFRRYWTGAVIDFRHLPIAQPAWNPVLNLFANANRWYTSIPPTFSSQHQKFSQDITGTA
ncbi:hypothetical protein AAVH_23354 [Aphelenchoides avenae]|nr:hypothetical protein AAVH_23350 [Aphelenchus avenae]KAH7709382.1 hypothetical protein AAVH_23354 [Aphelenchus avenae]